MIKLIKGSFHVIALLGIIFLFTVTANKYSWVTEMDPTIVIEDPSGNRGVFAVIVMVIICLVELIVFKLSENKAEKKISLIILVVAIFFWFFKYAF